MTAIVRWFWFFLIINRMNEWMNYVTTNWWVQTKSLSSSGFRVDGFFCLGQRIEFMLTFLRHIISIQIETQWNRLHFPLSFGRRFHFVVLPNPDKIRLSLNERVAKKFVNACVCFVQTKSKKTAHKKPQITIFFLLLFHFVVCVAFSSKMCFSPFYCRQPIGHTQIKWTD